MYESPVNIIYGEIQTKIIEELENQAIQALQNYGISVDKEELIKALMYDRQQYEKGYADAKAEEKWIPCSERLPENNRQVLVYARSVHFALAKYDEMRNANGIYEMQWVTFDAWKPFYKIKEVIAWMPLPDPYKERWEK